MKLNRQARFALILVAAALLVAGLVGPVRRAAESRDKARAAAEMRQQFERERVTRAEEYVARRDQVLADARAAIDRGDYPAALKIVSPYAPVPDESLRELFREAARAESMRQRQELMTALVARDCNEANVRNQVASMLEKAVEPGVTGEPPRTAVRLTGVEAREVVLTRLREPPHPELAGPQGAPKTEPAPGATAMPGPSTTPTDTAERTPMACGSVRPAARPNTNVPATITGYPGG